MKARRLNELLFAFLWHTAPVLNVAMCVALMPVVWLHQAWQAFDYVEPRRRITVVEVSS